MRRMKETDVAAPVVAWFKVSGYEVYQEVANGWGRPDIVAVKDGKVAICEVKTSLSWALLEQGQRWKMSKMCHYSWIASPWMKQCDCAAWLLRPTGIGWLALLNGRVEHNVPALIQEAPYADRMLERLREQQKDFCLAGKAGGGYYTDWKGARAAVVAAVLVKPGMTVKEAAAAANHCYFNTSSPYNILKWFGPSKDLLPELFPRKDEKGRWRLYPVGWVELTMEIKVE